MSSDTKVQRLCDELDLYILNFLKNLWKTTLHQKLRPAMCVHAHVNAGVHATRVQTPARDEPPALLLHGFPQYPPARLFLSQGFSLNPELTSLGYTSWPGASRVPVSAFPAVELQAQILHHLWLSAWVLGVKLRSSCSLGRHVTDL